MTIKYLTLFNTILNDAPQPWQIGFQDSATPMMEGIVEFHDQIFFYLIIILVFVTWILSSILFAFTSNKNKLSAKYENHGTYVPIQKYSKLNKKLYIRNYTTTTYGETSDNNICYVKIYENAYTMKKVIFSENQGKSGISMFTNKLTNDTYIGQSIDISKRLKNYLN